MHQSSIENMQKCFERFIKSYAWPGRSSIEVIDIGGANINGSYSDIFSGCDFSYRAADITANDNVDIVLDDPYKLPFENGSIDILISGQAFEHVEFFWLLFKEMVRVLKSDGVIILIAPSSGPIHRYPVDCYRFYPDAYRALAKYGNCEVLDIIHDHRGPWNDLVGVFTKSEYLDNSRTAQTIARKWDINRYEHETRPVSINIRHTDPGVEETKGSVKYLDVLERLHKELHPNTYLEIGIRRGNSLSLAKQPSIAIDPEPDITSELADIHDIYIKSSDDFFEFDASDVLRNRTIDLAFIDGMHLFEFVLRDFINVEKFSTPSTVVVIDDISPNHYIQAQRHRNSQVWTGDVWKLASCLEKHRKDLQLTYLDTHPTGLLIITGLKPGNTKLSEKYNPIIREYKHQELDNDSSNKIITREKSIDPLTSEYWAWLSEFVVEVKNALSNNKSKVAAQKQKQLQNSGILHA